MTTKTDASDEKALAPGEETPAAVAEYAPPQGIVGELDKSDRVIPVCSLVQPMSQDKGVEGRYSFPSGVSVESLNAVVLQIRATRALWLPIDEKPDGPLCGSNDRVMGRTSDAGRVMGDPSLNGEDMYLPCNECRFEQTADLFEKIDSLWCPKGYTLLMYEQDLELPFLYYVKGTAVKPVKRRIVSPALERNEPPWTRPLSWTIKLVQETGRKYYTPVIEVGDKFAEDDVNHYAMLCAELSSQAAEQEEVT